MFFLIRVVLRINIAKKASKTLGNGKQRGRFLVLTIIEIIEPLLKYANDKKNTLGSHLTNIVTILKS